MICKVEHSSRGENPRFVVTTLDEFSPGLIYDVAYCARGQSSPVNLGSAFDGRSSSTPAGFIAYMPDLTPEEYALFCRSYPQGYS